MIGPAGGELPLSREKLLGAEGRGTDARLFELGMNVWSLHYLRVTGQLLPHEVHPQLAHLTTLFTQVMRRFHPRGYFTNWDSSSPSVWLTAWALRLFTDAMYAEWENTLYIEERILERAVKWLTTQQTPEGSFLEPSVRQHSIDSKIQLNESEVSLTGHVVVALTAVVPLLEGEVRSPAREAKDRAVDYLERRLNMVHDPYQLALLAHALTLAQSNERDIAFRKLMLVASTNTDGLEYWSWKKVASNPIKLENQRPFMKPRLYHEGDSEAVEGTAYALLVLLARDGVTPIADRVVQWLQSMRTTHSAFVSTMDSVVATMALTEYANRARLFDLTRVDVAVRLSSAEQFRPSFHIANHSRQHTSLLKLPSVWGHVNVVARGRGLALVQLEVSYGVDYEPLVDRPSLPSFQLTVSERYSTFRNKSAITVTACTRWVRDWPVVSGAAVLEYQLPSGYRMLEDEANRLTEDHPVLAAAKTTPTKTLWFFEHVPREWVCFNHTVKRWYPVANLSFYREAIIYELTARERFEQVLLNSTPLYVLNICEVCGSYQCPYCPFYNTATLLLPPVLTFMAAAIFITRL